MCLVKAESFLKSVLAAGDRLVVSTIVSTLYESGIQMIENTEMRTQQDTTIHRLYTCRVDTLVE